MTVILDEAGITGALREMADAIAAELPQGVPIGIIGIRQRGDILAERLRQHLENKGYDDIAFGTLDITLYRDDLAEIGPSAIVRTTEIPFDVEGRYLVLVDDVIYSGRSIRSALAATIDLGRPKAIRLAVLVNRGGRELPIQPDYVGFDARQEARHIDVKLRERDGAEGVEVGA